MSNFRLIPSDLTVELRLLFIYLQSNLLECKTDIKKIKTRLFLYKEAKVETKLLFQKANFL